MHIETVLSDNKDFAALWTVLERGCVGEHGWLGALYQPATARFYQSVRGTTAKSDHSFLIVVEDVPVYGLLMKYYPAFAPVHESNGENVGELSCDGLPVVFLENEAAASSLKQAAANTLKKTINTCFDAFEQPFRIISRDYLQGGKLSPLSHSLLSQGASSTPHFTKVLNLDGSPDEWRAQMSKTVRWSINWGLKNIELTTLTAQTVETSDIDEFKRLHLAVAGRQTRPDESWRRQYDQVKAGEAFVVFGRMDGELVTAALFVISDSHCYYGVSASKRDLFDKPISHCIIWTAINYCAEKKNVRHFEMGDILYAGVSTAEIDAKLLGISFFKQSFGGETRVVLDITHNTLDESVVGAKS